MPALAVLPALEADVLPILLLASLAAAAEPEFVEPETPGQEFEEPETHLSAELGGAWATGNSVYYTLNGKLDGSHRYQRNAIALGLGVNTGKGVIDADGDGILSDEERRAERVEIARKLWADLRYDRFVGEHGSLYALAGALSDVYSGYELRTHEQLGYSRILVEDEQTTLKLEAGADVAQENYTEGVEPGRATIFAARGLFSLEHSFSDSLSLTESLEVFENVIDFEDFRAINEAALSASLSDAFSVKLSSQLTFDNVPVEGYRPLDVVNLVSLVATLL